MLAIFSVLLTTCSNQFAEISPEGKLELFDGLDKLSVQNFPTDWILEGVSQNQLLEVNNSITIINNKNTLSITSLPTDYVLLRKIRANLMASPFLGWSWKIPSNNTGSGQVRIIVGFYGGKTNSYLRNFDSIASFTNKGPRYDRIANIVLGKSLNGEKSIEKADQLYYYSNVKLSSKASDWFNENLDLSALYRRKWPVDSLINTQISFVGFLSTSETAPVVTQIQNVVLYR
ncbi:MAG: hypothetical protein VX617_02865 [Pseudomonadota bacterium]|nr:hypothetical protein [Pseudomonadota bacterium]